MRPGARHLWGHLAGAGLTAASAATAAWLVPLSGGLAAALGATLAGRAAAREAFRLDRIGWSGAGRFESSVRFMSVAAGSLIAWLLLWSSQRGGGTLFWIVESALHLLLVELISSAIAWREWRRNEPKQPGRRTLIYGAGRSGRLLLAELRENHRLSLDAFGFLDDDPTLEQAVVDGVPVLGSIDALPRLAELHEVKDLLAAIPVLSPQRREHVTELTEQAGVHCRFVPTLSEALEPRLERKEASRGVSDLLALGLFLNSPANAPSDVAERNDSHQSGKEDEEQAVERVDNLAGHDEIDGKAQASKPEHETE